MNHATGAPDAVPGGLGLYLHIPFCDPKCPYCVFYSRCGVDPALIDRYLEALNVESRLRRRNRVVRRAPDTVYIGGGTPSLLSTQQLKRLCTLVRTVWQPVAGAEWTVECNPGSLDADKLAVMSAAGVNRISLGAQSLDDRVLRILGRRHDTAAVCRAVDMIRAAGILNYNLDLIACVPGVGPRRWQNILSRALALQPVHLSVYALTLDEGQSLPVPAAQGRRCPPPDDRQQLRFLRKTAEQLQAAGYQRYEISNYARRGKRCRHHQSFWRGGDYVGLGTAAASRLGLCQRNNTSDLEAYVSALAHGIDAPHAQSQTTPLSAAAERMAFGLRQTEGIALTPWLKRLGLPHGPHDWPRPALRMLARNGLISMRRGRVVPTSRGLEVVDALALELWPDAASV